MVGNPKPGQGGRAKRRRTLLAVALAVLAVAGAGVAVAQIVEGSTASIPGMTSSFDNTAEAGINVNPNTNLEGVRVRIGGGIAAGSEPTNIYVYDGSGNELYNRTVGELSSNDTEIIDLAMSSGSTYSIAFDRGGANYDSATVAGGASFPYTSSDIDITSSYGDSGSVANETTALLTVDRDYLRIFNESAPDEYVAYPTEVTARFVGTDGSVFEYTTTNGTVPMDALPDQAYFVTIETSGGSDYHTQSFFISGPTTDQDVYLLPTSAPHTDTIFHISDYTGSFPASETALKIERFIDGDWETVSGGNFDVTNSYSTQLRQDAEHRLTLVNTETGQERELGTYTPITSAQEEVTVSPTGGIEEIDAPVIVSVEPSTRTLPARDDVNVSVTIQNGTDPFSSWSVSIYHIDGASNTTLYSDSFTDASGGSVEQSLDLDGLEGEVKVVTSYDNSGGDSGRDVARYDLIEGPTTSMTLLDGILGMVGLVPDSDEETVMALTAMILTIGGTTAVGSVFRMTTEGMGMVALALVGAFAIIGWVEYNLFFIVLVLFASIVFIRRRW